MTDLYIDPNTGPLEILKALDSWADRTTTSNIKSMWALLTALRGPDEENFEVKESTTAVIRRDTLPRMAMRAGAVVATKEQNLSTKPTSSPHFDLHIQYAWAKLTDLKWEERVK